MKVTANIAFTRQKFKLNQKVREWKRVLKFRCVREASTISKGFANRYQESN